MSTPGHLACAILSMTYGDLMDVAGEFSDAIADREAWPKGCKTSEEFATLLYNWAEAQEDTAEIEEANKK